MVVVHTQVNISTPHVQRLRVNIYILAKQTIRHMGRGGGMTNLAMGLEVLKSMHTNHKGVV